MNNTNESNKLKNRIVKLVGRNFIVTTVVIAVTVCLIASVIIIQKNNALRNATADAALQGTSGWFGQQISQVEVIANTLAYEDYVGTRYDESESFLADCINTNSAAYAYYFGLSDDRCVFSDGWEVPSDYKAT